MKKLNLLLFVLLLILAVPASALEYSIDAPEGPDYGIPTSVEPVYTADRGERKNKDVSKNAALIPPAFGSPSADALDTGTYLTPNLAPNGRPAVGAVINGTGAVQTPGSTGTDYSGMAYTKYTDLTSDLYYKDGSIGILKAPDIKLSVRVYEGTDAATLKKGAGHFEETSVWDGNAAFASHNRGANDYFGKIHTLEVGDRITWTTKLGTRTYEVISVAKVSETDRSGLASSTENMLTLYTCVRDQREYRWCVQAVER
jgi:sortase A